MACDSNVVCKFRERILRIPRDKRFREPGNRQGGVDKTGTIDLTAVVRFFQDKSPDREESADIEKR